MAWHPQRQCSVSLVGTLFFFTVCSRVGHAHTLLILYLFSTFGWLLYWLCCIVSCCIALYIPLTSNLVPSGRDEWSIAPQKKRTNSWVKMAGNCDNHEWMESIVDPHLVVAKLCSVVSNSVSTEIPETLVHRRLEATKERSDWFCDRQKDR